MPHVPNNENRIPPFHIDNIHRFHPQHIFALIMNINQPLIRRPIKKRRTKKSTCGITEGDDSFADGIIVETIVKETSRGLVEEEIHTPVFLNATQPTSTPPARSSNCSTSREANNNLPEGFQGQEDDFYQAPFLHDDNNGARRTGRSQSHYIQEFVDRVHPLMKALLSREVRPSTSICDACTNGNIAIWRCRDCTAAHIHCRACIRESHEACPTHRIEVWNGEFFRSAELWEVGLHILVRHHADSRLCPTLKFRQNVLGNFQHQRDLKE